MAAYAAQQLVDNNIDKIVITRPTVEAGSKGIGYLKGDLNDKFLVWTWPFLKGFHFILGKSYYEYLRKIERIDICPIQFAQGMSFGGVDERVLILCDEFENATIQEMKMILTRVGEGARIFISGDTQQSMIRESGLLHSIHLLRNVPGVSHIRYTSSDIVRSEFTRRVVDAFDTIQYSTDYHGVFAPQ
jgi:phosphate starvation-inducible PhoH-like protein